MGIRRFSGGILAVVGGALMFVSGFASRGLLFIALGYAEQEIPSILSGFAAGAATLAVSLLQLMIALGGITVFVGGLAILYKHVGTGRILIFLGGGAGFLGLLVSFGYTAYKLGPSPTITFAPYWIGLALAVTGRHLAKGT